MKDPLRQKSPTLPYEYKVGLVSLVFIATLLAMILTSVFGFGGQHIGFGRGTLVGAGIMFAWIRSVVWLSGRRP